MTLGCSTEGRSYNENPREHLIESSTCTVLKTWFDYSSSHMKYACKSEISFSMVVYTMSKLVFR